LRQRRTRTDQHFGRQLATCGCLVVEAPPVLLFAGTSELAFLVPHQSQLRPSSAHAPMRHPQLMRSGHLTLLNESGTRPCGNLTCRSSHRLCGSTKNSLQVGGPWVTSPCCLQAAILIGFLYVIYAKAHGIYLMGKSAQMTYCKDQLGIAGWWRPWPP